MMYGFPKNERENMEERTNMENDNPGRPSPEPW